MDAGLTSVGETASAEYIDEDAGQIGVVEGKRMELDLQSCRCLIMLVKCLFSVPT